jgi:tRNA-binding protein
MEILKEMEQITWKHFERIELRVGTIIEVDDFP